MKMIFPGKNGRVTFLHSSSSTTIPSFGKILRREIPELLRTHTRTDGRTDTSLSQAVAQLKLRTAASLKAQVSTLVPFKPSQLQPSSLHTSFTSLRLHNQTLFTFISCNMSQVQLLHFKKMAKSLPFYSFIGYFFT